MRATTTFALGAIALALGAFILLRENRTLSSGELAGREHELLREFARDRVTKIELHRGRSHVVLTRPRPEDDELGGRWRLRQPVEAPADRDMVESLLGEMEWAMPRRVLEQTTRADRKRFGLSKPWLKASFTAADRTVPIRVGGEDPQGGGHYVTVGEDRKVYVVGKEFAEALSQDGEHFRQKKPAPTDASTQAPDGGLDGGTETDANATPPDPLSR